MWLTYDGMEMLKVTNTMVDGDFRYTVYCMGEELWTVSPMTWWYQVMADGKMMQENMYYMYKFYETYFWEMQEWEEADWMDFIAHLGNWDYSAQKVHEWEKAFLQAEKDKCMVSVDDMHAKYGIYLGEKGKSMILKKMDEHVQFCEWAETNGIDKMMYFQHMAAKEFEAKHSMMTGGMEMQPCYQEEEAMPEGEPEDNMPEGEPEMPEFLYIERDNQEMEEAAQSSCDAWWTGMMVEHEMMGSMIIEGYVQYRDAWRMQTQAVLDKVNDRANAEFVVDSEIARMEAMRDDRWSCEFDAYHQYYMMPEEIEVRKQQCSHHMDIYWSWEDEEWTDPQGEPEGEPEMTGP